MHQPLIIAHRGASASAPENTMASIYAAVKAKVDYIEVDIRLSKEGIPVLCHDSHVEKIVKNGVRTPIAALTLDAIKQFDAGSWFDEKYRGERIPTLEEALNVDTQGIGWMLEIKKSVQPAAVIVKAVMDVLHKCSKCSRSLGPIVIGSFALDILAELKNQAGGLPIIGIMEKKGSLPIFCRMGLPYVAIWEEIITKEMVEFLKGNGIHVWSFTVDEPRRQEELVLLGVEGLITNAPEKAIKR